MPLPTVTAAAATRKAPRLPYSPVRWVTEVSQGLLPPESRRDAGQFCGIMLGITTA